MALKNLFLIGYLLIITWGAECPDSCIAIDDICYYKKHLDVLQDFVDENQSLKGIEPHKIGYQEWENNRLTYLYLGDNNIVSIPDSIGLLKDLNNLDFRENQIQSIPEGICNIYPYYTDINLSGNKICPPYPYCFDYIGNQEILDCVDFSCLDGYLEIKGECYKEDHIQVLQGIIDSNPILRRLTPLELGEEIGYQKWEYGKLTHLNLISNQLTTLPETLCTIYPYLKTFDVSNNSICPPYPVCIEYLGYQNTQDCIFPDKSSETDSTDNIIDNFDITSANDLSNINSIYFQNDLDILQSFIDKNNSLEGMQPLAIGNQTWSNMRLISLDLSSADLKNIPAELCNIYANLTMFDISNNAICPPYPECMEYIGIQSCDTSTCPDGYMDIDGECYYEPHLNVLQDIIINNTSLQNKKPLEIARETGLQKWQNGRLDQLVLNGSQLTDLPESICTIYQQLSVFGISNNSICPPYPPCVENIGYQNTNDCNKSITCLEGYVAFDKKCYYYTDLEVLIDFTNMNPSLENYHPLQIGYQVWGNNRLQQLYIDDMNIIGIPENIYNLNHLEYLSLNNNKLKTLPESIYNLDHLEYLGLNNNQLEILPESICNIYSNLKSFDIMNNLLCPPYPNCFDFIGQQNTANCEHDLCFYGYTEIEGECYYEKDVSVLLDFININESLKGKNPLEIGVQKWENMRLDFLYLGVNQLSDIPNSICEINSNLKTLNLSQNKICPPYPGCIEEYVGEQNTSDCQQ